MNEEIKNKYVLLVDSLWTLPLAELQDKKWEELEKEADWGSWLKSNRMNAIQRKLHERPPSPRWSESIYEAMEQRERREKDNWKNKI